MSQSLITACVWVLGATLVALLPMRHQMLPGIALLVAAPVLLVWIGLQHGPVWVAVGVFGFVSMFRKPLVHIARKALGLPTPDPRRTET